MLYSLTLMTALAGPATLARPALTARPATPSPDCLAPAPARLRPTYQVAADTEVVLDGKRCPYARVPAGARVVGLEVSEDNVAIRIAFRSPD